MKKIRNSIFIMILFALFCEATELKRTGWNLISVCQDMNRSQIDMTGISEIQNQSGQSIYTGEFVSFSNLNTLESGYGYWIKGNVGTEFNSGESNTSLIKLLKRNSWNLMAVCEHISKDDVNMTNLEEIQSQDGKSIYTGEFASSSNLESLLNGYGHWVKGTEGTSFTSKRATTTIMEIPVLAETLSTYLKKMKFGSESDNLWQSSSPIELQIVQEIVEKILNAEYVGAYIQARTLNGEVVKVIDVNKSYYVLHLGLNRLSDGITPLMEELMCLIQQVKILLLKFLILLLTQIQT